jgi:hypothetical protein
MPRKDICPICFNKERATSEKCVVCGRNLCIMCAYRMGEYVVTCSPSCDDKYMDMLGKTQQGELFDYSATEEKTTDTCDVCGKLITGSYTGVVKDKKVDGPLCMEVVIMLVQDNKESSMADVLFPENAV